MRHVDAGPPRGTAAKGVKGGEEGGRTGRRSGTGIELSEDERGASAAREKWSHNKPQRVRRCDVLLLRNDVGGWGWSVSGSSSLKDPWVTGRKTRRRGKERASRGGGRNLAAVRRSYPKVMQDANCKLQTPLIVRYRFRKIPNNRDRPLRVSTV